MVQKISNDEFIETSIGSCAFKAVHPPTPMCVVISFSFHLPSLFLPMGSENSQRSGFKESVLT